VNDDTADDYDHAAEVAYWRRALRSAPAARRIAASWVVEHGQHPPSCGRVRGERCNCGLAALKGREE
jgi:hypothetical protein